MSIPFRGAALATLVFVNLYDYTTSRSTLVVFPTMFVWECSRPLGLQRCEHHHCSVTLQSCRIDHGLRVCRNFLFSAPNPNSGIRADLCIVVLVQLECIENAGIDFLIVTLLFASVHICGTIGLQVAS
jgi:hypothetical protein